MLESNLVLNEEDIYEQIWSDSWDILLSEKNNVQKTIYNVLPFVGKEGEIRKCPFPLILF